MAGTSVGDLPIVGRDSELASLAALVTDAAAGRGRVALLSGDAGIGKTTLAEAAAGYARAAGLRIGWGRCPPAVAPPYWPWTQVLRALDLDADLFEAGRFASRPELSAGLAEAIATRTRDDGVLVVLEDMHWADAGSRDLLEFVAGTVSGQRLLVLSTARPEDKTAVPRLEGAGVRRLELEGIDLPATRSLVLRIAGAEPSEEYAAEVFRRTGGNPFFAAEVARLQASRGRPAGVVPAAVRQVLEYRLARLPHESFALLQLASVLGAPEPERLARVSGHPVSHVRALLAAAAEARIVVGPEFAHELLRETLYLGLGDSRRADLHRQVAEHLQAEGPAELARHWSLAAGDDAPGHAAELSLVAGDMAAAGLAHEQAVGHYRAAIELGRRSLDVRLRLGAAQVQAGHIADGRATLRRVARTARDGGNGEVLAQAVLAMGGGLGGFEVDLSDPDQVPLLEDAMRLLPSGDSALRAAVLARLSLARAGSAPFEDRAALAADAVAMARRIDDPVAEIAALAGLCDACSGPDDLARRLDAADRMVALGHHDAVLELLARRIRLRARLEMGDIGGVRSDLAAYAGIAERLCSPTYGWLVPMWRGMLAELEGDLASAERHVAELAELAQAAQSTNGELMAWSLRWRIARRRHDTDEIRRLATVLAGWSDGYTAPWDCSYALLRAESGDPAGARRHLSRVMESGIAAVPRDSEWLELVWSLGEAAILLDDADAARAVHTALAPYAELWAVDGYGAACFGQVRDLLARLDEYAGRAAVETGARFVRAGPVWQLAFGGKAATVPDSKGMRDVAVLLARPGQEVHVLDLVEAAGGPARAVADADTGPVLDAAARTAYRQRLLALEDELDEAALDQDLGRSERLQEEKEFLLAELGAAFGLGGRVRVGGDRVERARKAVTMRIGTAQKSIARVHPDLARHLRHSVATGRFCCYRPEEDVTWVTV